MLAHSHIVVACAGWWALWERSPVVLAGAAPPGQGHLVALAATTAVVAIAALLPDLDHPRGALARYRLGRRGSMLRHVRPLAPLSAVLHWEFGHRGALHSLVAAGLLYLVGVQFLGPQVGLALGWGYAAHLLADALTREGVPLFWPLLRKRITPLGPFAVRTGALGEQALVALIVAAAVWYGFALT